MVPTVPITPTWQAQTDQWSLSRYCPTRDLPSGADTVMSKPPIEMYVPLASRGLSRVFGSNKVSATAVQDPIGSGFVPGVTVTFQFACAKADSGIGSAKTNTNAVAHTARRITVVSSP